MQEICIDELRFATTYEDSQMESKVEERGMLGDWSLECDIIGIYVAHEFIINAIILHNPFVVVYSNSIRFPLKDKSLPQNESFDLLFCF